MKTFKTMGLALLMIYSIAVVTSCETTSYSAGSTYSNPSWAPDYYPGVRYYYLPDIEVYYDLSNHEFIYLDNGQWLFSQELSPFYTGFDLYNGYVIALNLDVFQPWMHHQYYISHYPRYYYHNFYRSEEIGHIRGFNENVRKPFYRRQDERMNDFRREDRRDRKDDISRPPRKPNDISVPPQKPTDINRPPQRPNDISVPPQKPNDTNRPPQKPNEISVPTQKPTDINRPHQKPNEISVPPPKPADISRPPQNIHEISRPPQKPHYYGKDIGQPVKVRPNMKENRTMGRP